MEHTIITRDVVVVYPLPPYIMEGPTSPLYVIRDLRAKLLVACLVTPALWLNLSDSRNILIIHF